ncbi:hypothetical protein RF11_06614 [Thelohanellus kitauei]|uniref:Uncharacterized protein n=1 Tax=Thelohanellus kitauei TaxID=669202 RepID=A0A0C2JCX3_THEKT|nr:hypothetical protein RF11_06614 [Thelohanellus kitauei]
MPKPTLMNAVRELRTATSCPWPTLATVQFPLSQRAASTVKSGSPSFTTDEKPGENKWQNNMQIIADGPILSKCYSQNSTVHKTDNRPEAALTVKARKGFNGRETLRVNGREWKTAIIAASRYMAPVNGTIMATSKGHQRHRLSDDVSRIQVLDRCYICQEHRIALSERGSIKHTQIIGLLTDDEQIDPRALGYANLGTPKETPMHSIEALSRSGQSVEGPVVVKSATLDLRRKLCSLPLSRCDLLSFGSIKTSLTLRAGRVSVGGSLIFNVTLILPPGEYSAIGDCLHVIWPLVPLCQLHLYRTSGVSSSWEASWVARTLLSTGYDRENLGFGHLGQVQGVCVPDLVSQSRDTKKKHRKTSSYSAFTSAGGCVDNEKRPGRSKYVT